MKKITTLFWILGVIAFALLPLLFLTGCLSAYNRDRTVHEIYSPATGKLAERWTDYHSGGARTVLADPKASQLDRTHANQTALGGASSIQIGAMSSEVSTNGISASGGAVGNIIEKAIQGAKK